MYSNLTNPNLTSNLNKINQAYPNLGKHRLYYNLY